MPPLIMEEIVGFRLVPTVEKEIITAGDSSIRSTSKDFDTSNVPSGRALSTDSSADNNKNTSESNFGVPALMLLTQVSDDDSSSGDSVVRHLKLLRCPTSSVVEWPLEIGLLPDPRRATEVLPGDHIVTVRVILKINVVCIFLQ